MKVITLTLFVAAGLALNLSLSVFSREIVSTDHPPGELHCDEDFPEDPGFIVFECPPSKPGVISYFPFPYNCRKFIECLNGTKTCFICAPGTVWNDAIKTCDHQAECNIVTTPPPAQLPK